MILTVAQVAGACRSDPLHVATNWPVLCDALARYAVEDGPTEVALAATVAVETAYTFQPCSEKWARGETMDTYFTRKYAPPARVAHWLGNRDAEDAVHFRGRGFIQITGRANYTTYGNKVGVDLLTTPERALDPYVSADIAACYVADHHVPALAAAGDWPGVRAAVNGGVNGLAEFQAIVDVLLTHL